MQGQLELLSFHMAFILGTLDIPFEDKVSELGIQLLVEVGMLEPLEE